MTMARKVIKTDGREVALDRATAIRQCRQTFGVTGPDVVRLRSLGTPLYVMLVDDNCFIDDAPVNGAATALYAANCYPRTPRDICGDVAIVLDEDLELGAATRQMDLTDCSPPRTGRHRHPAGSKPHIRLRTGRWNHSWSPLPSLERQPDGRAATVFCDRLNRLDHHAEDFDARR